MTVSWSHVNSRPMKAACGFLPRHVPLPCPVTMYSERTPRAPAAGAAGPHALRPEAASGALPRGARARLRPGASRIERGGDMPEAERAVRREAPIHGRGGG